MNNLPTTYKTLGMMSGSSLDGVDICYAIFEKTDNGWSYELLHSECLPYSKIWMDLLPRLANSTAKVLWAKHLKHGDYLGMQAANFIEKHKLQVDVIGSHGHTIMHAPAEGYSCQIGAGNALAARANAVVVTDFRSADIAAGGQGAPIVPIGDKHLFPEHSFFLNIGGIANISYKMAYNIVAFDICSANQVLNHYAGLLGKEYDDAGTIARSGSLNMGLLTALNSMPFYGMKYPKSLDNSFTTQYVLPTIEQFQISLEDKLHTYTEHIAQQVTNSIAFIQLYEKITIPTSEKMLITGGGALNTFLVERIEANCPWKVEVPDFETVKFKEALVMAFMAVLRLRNEVNILASVTGAKHNTVGGAIYHP